MRKRRKASVEATLVYYDAPQLMALKAGTRQVVAVAVPEYNEYSMPFFATPVSDADWDNYLSGKSDLRFFFEGARLRSPFVFDLAVLTQNQLWLRPIDEAEVPENWFPKRGFFADSHTEDYRPEESAAGVSKLQIDGSWEMYEFGHFQKRYADLYNFIVSRSDYEADTLQDSRRRIYERALNTRPFQGGSSYMQYFEDLSVVVPPRDRIHLKSIIYASPGDIQMNGRREVFDHVHSMVEDFLSERSVVSETHGQLRGFMSRNRFLRVSGRHVNPTEADSDFIVERATELLERLNVQNPRGLLELCEGNAVVFGKIALSIFRRVEAVAGYFIQGRIWLRRG